ncbi:MAG: sulfur carrier protein ThiS [Planctomycetes bacterium]|nr:sulfur carrier protein ThiS [Planctomycetota bacterium]
MRITVNGEARELEAGATVAQLLAALALKSELVAVERNAALVPRREHAATQVKDGDRFEIVTLVGGG